MPPIAGKANKRGIFTPWARTLAALFIAALGWRVLCVWRLDQSVLAGALNADARIYWDWAGFLRTHGPIGKNAFFMGPLYPYVIAALRSIVGDSITPVLYIQCLWGAAACVLLADATRRLTSPAIGLTLGILLAGYQTAVFFDIQVLMESLLFFLESLLLWVVLQLNWENPRARSLLLIGALVGLLAQGRATSLFLLAPLLLIILQQSPARREGLRRAALVAIACAAMAVPTGLRNRVVSGEWIPFTYNLGYNFFVGNNPEATGSYVVVTGSHEPPPDRGFGEDGGMQADGRAFLRATTGRAFSPSGSSSYWADQALTYARAHPMETVRLTLRKLGMLWSWREFPQIESLETFGAAMGPLGLPLLGGFGLLGILGLAGCLVALRRGPAARFTVGYLVMTSIAIVPFFVTDRFRHHLVPGLAITAALALSESLRAIQTRSLALAARLAGALVVASILVCLPEPGRDATRVAWDTAYELGDVLLLKGRPDLAVIEYEKATTLARSGRLQKSSTSTARVAQAALYQNYATALLQLGRDRDAVEWYEAARQLAPDSRLVMLGLAEGCARTGQSARASQLYEQLGMSEIGAAKGFVQQAQQAARSGQLDKAEEYLGAAVALGKDQLLPWDAMIRFYVENGRLEDACNAVARARQAGVAGSAVAVHAALIDAAEGKMDKAERTLRSVPPSAIQSEPLLADLVRYIRAMGPAGGNAKPAERVH